MNGGGSHFKGCFFNAYKLKKGVSVSDFLLAVEQLRSEYIAKQNGYCSFQLLVDGETWADATTFETMQDAKILRREVTRMDLRSGFTPS